MALVDLLVCAPWAVSLLLWIDKCFPWPCVLATHTLLPYIQSSVVLKLIANNFPRLSVISDKDFCFLIVIVLGGVSRSSLPLIWQNCFQLYPDDFGTMISEIYRLKNWSVFEIQRRKSDLSQPLCLIQNADNFLNVEPREKKKCCPF